MKVFRWFVNGIKILLALGEEAMSRTQIVVGFPVSEVDNDTKCSGTHPEGNQGTCASLSHDLVWWDSYFE